MGKFKKNYSELSVINCFEFFEPRLDRTGIIKSLRSILISRLGTKECDKVLYELFKFSKWMGSYYNTLPDSVKRVYLAHIRSRWSLSIIDHLKGIDEYLLSHINCLINGYFASEQRRLIKSSNEDEIITLLIVADYNDADYVKDVVKIKKSVFNKFRSLIYAINNFQPYIRRSRYGGINYNNWGLVREGDLDCYEKYPQISVSLVDEFKEIVMGGLRTPECYDIEDFHTIVSLENVVTGEIYIKGDYQTVSTRKSPEVIAYLKERSDIYSYKRPSDGKPLNSIPFVEMTKEESEMIEKVNNLWKKYVK